MRQSGAVGDTCIAGFKHLPKGIITGEGRRKGACVQFVPILVGMIIQRNDDPLACDDIVISVRYVIKNEPAPGPTIEPTVYSFQGCFVDVLEIAVLLKYPGLDSCADIIAAVPVIRLYGADFVILHLASPILRVGAIPTAECAAMDPVEAESVHIYHHILFGAGGIIRSSARPRSCLSWPFP